METTKKVADMDMEEFIQFATTKYNCTEKKMRWALDFYMNAEIEGFAEKDCALLGLAKAKTALVFDDRLERTTENLANYPAAVLYLQSRTKKERLLTQFRAKTIASDDEWVYGAYAYVENEVHFIIDNATRTTDNATGDQWWTLNEREVKAKTVERLIAYDKDNNGLYANLNTAPDDQTLRLIQAMWENLGRTAEGLPVFKESHADQFFDVSCHVAYNDNDCWLTLKSATNDNGYVIYLEWYNDLNIEYNFHDEEEFEKFKAYMESFQIIDD